MSRIYLEEKINFLREQGHDVPVVTEKLLDEDLRAMISDHVSKNRFELEKKIEILRGLKHHIPLVTDDISDADMKRVITNVVRGMNEYELIDYLRMFDFILARTSLVDMLMSRPDRDTIKYALTLENVELYELNNRGEMVSNLRDATKDVSEDVSEGFSSLTDGR